MKNYIGIDLGTTNSSICSYDGTETRIWKSPEQNDVTPSAIYIDRRGSRFVGQRAYDSAARSPENAATLFKRFMGTETPVIFKALDLASTPEECSAEILKTLFGYLPEEFRAASGTGTVITVPAAFNQMQKDATLQAATMAGIGNVALMQEPVASVMSVMRTRRKNGKFLVYDLGGGTFDIALAESVGGRVSLLTHGGIAMCGGRDIDRMLWDNVVHPWLRENFTLPTLLTEDPQYRTLHHLGMWATEKAKIELSAREESIVNLTEIEVRTRDSHGKEIYIHLPLGRSLLDPLMDETIKETIHETRDMLSKAGVAPSDIDSIVFIGGPTNYKPLRDKVSFELGIPANIDVNPMTAVAEGASLFAESVDWSTRTHSRKNTRGQISSGGKLPVTFSYISRTSDQKAKIGVKISSPQEGYEFQIDSADTAWTSGRMPLRHGSVIEVFLSRPGENTFRSSVFDTQGMPVQLENNVITVVRTAAAVDSIPASHSVAIEVLERLGGQPSLDYLVKAGDSLPAKGKRVYKAAETLKAGDANSLNFKLWEGDIADRISDNRPIGVLKVSGSDLGGSVVPAGADLVFEYEILDSGNILVGVSIPCIGATFDSSGKNFYSRQEGQVNYLSDSVAEKIVSEGKQTIEQIDEMAAFVSDERLEHARRKLEAVAVLDSDEKDPEKSKEADERLLEARKILSEVRRENLSEFRKKKLERMASEFEEQFRQFAKPSEVTDFHNLVKTARRAMDRKDAYFDELLSQMQVQTFQILWRQDFFVVEFFKSLVGEQEQFTDTQQFQALLLLGFQCMQNDDFDSLRQIVGQLLQLRASGFSESMFDLANIIRG